MSYCPSLLPDDHIFFVDNSYQYRIPPSNIINGHFKTNDGMGIGFIDTLFVDPKQFKIFSLPTIIQLPNGRWIIDNFCVPESEKSLIIDRVCSGTKFCPLILKMLFNSVYCDMSCNRCRNAEKNGEMNLRCIRENVTETNSFGIFDLEADTARKLPNGFQVKASSIMHNIERPITFYGPSDLGVTYMQYAAEWLTLTKPMCLLNYRRFKRIKVRRNYVGVEDMNGKRLITCNASHIKLFVSCIADDPEYFECEVEAQEWVKKQPKQFLKDHIYLYTL